MFKPKASNLVVKGCAQSEGYFECCKNGNGSTAKIFLNYLEAKHVTYKTNPMDQAKAPKNLVWRKKNEGLIKVCTWNRYKEKHGGKVTIFCCYITW